VLTIRISPRCDSNDPCLAISNQHTLALPGISTTLFYHFAFLGGFGDFDFLVYPIKVAQV